MSEVRRALFFSFAERYLQLIVALGSNLLLARLLTPEQIGVFSVSLAVIGIAQALRDFGVGNYLIQEPDLTSAKVASAFTISIAIGAVLFIGTLLASSAVASFYGEPRMAYTVRIAALNFLLLPIGTVCMSLLRRQMQFKRLLAVGTSSTVLGALVSVGLALAGMGENSLALGAVATNVSAALLAWLLARQAYALRLGWAHWREVANFGGLSSMSGVVTSVSMDANDLVVGKLLGFPSVAMLSRAQGLSYLVHRDLLGAVRNVALPALSKAHREGSDIGTSFLRGVANLAVIAWALYGLLACFAVEAVHILYGSQWLDSAKLVPVFCIAGVFAAVNVMTPNLLVAVGQMKVMAWLDMVFQPMRVALIAGAAMWFRTLEACAWAFCLSALVTLPVFWATKRRYVPDDTSQLVRLLAASAITAGVVVLPSAILCAFAGFGRTQPLPLWLVLPLVLLGVLLGLCSLHFTRHPLADEPVVRKALATIRLRDR